MLSADDNTVKHSRFRNQLQPGSIGIQRVRRLRTQSRKGKIELKISPDSPKRSSGPMERMPEKTHTESCRAAADNGFLTPPEIDSSRKNAAAFGCTLRR